MKRQQQLTPTEEPRIAYRGPEVIDVGDVALLTTAGGEKIVDSYGPDGHTAIDWNKLNNPAPDKLDPDAS